VPLSNDQTKSSPLWEAASPSFWHFGFGDEIPSSRSWAESGARLYIFERLSFSLLNDLRIAAGQVNIAELMKRRSPHFLNIQQLC
jgi:hypothetical protein